MDKTKLNDYSKRIWQESVNVFTDLEHLRLAILNIKISVAKIDSGEHRALATVADYLSDSIDSIEAKTGRIRDLSKHIGREINQSE
ncbi:hypothetical protein HNQ80_001542 [Anaerosolibacter carboniphilus]|uniref:Uncharacterized protein n=1 Tax=Anaerosolibacter carboniphilus TaxID=1417629 RepID=A0A841KPU8_9FIRM|nr:hypothetical protein [Anaerosolibacter carboniphilus]MBB6215453.1 hypothetical protein [Anaerosolibacter carboniphilus]